jgi:hypothetical protein
MPGIQFSAGTYSTPSNAIRLQNFLLTYNAGGPTSETGYWTQYPSPNNGWVIYIDKSAQGPSVYVCNNDTDLVNSASQLSNTTITTVTDAIAYFNNQSNKMLVGTPLPNIPLDGLQMYLDSAIVQSYNRTGTTWNDLTSYGNNGTLANGPTFNSVNGGSIVFDGVNDYVSVQSSLDSLNGTAEASLVMWVKLNSSSNSSGQSGIIQLSGHDNSNGNLYFYTDSTRVGGIWLDIFRTNRVFTGDWAPTFNATNWHMLTVTTTPGTDGWKMYLNGILRYQTTGQSTVSINSSIQGGLNIGRNSLSRELAGNIAITQVYNQALSADKVLQNYNATKSRFGI